METDSLAVLLGHMATDSRCVCEPESVRNAVQGSDVVVAIIGGTLLTLALSRPRIDWLQKATEGRESWRQWVERGLTWWAFVMGGYAYASLFSVLHQHVSPLVDHLLEGAAGFLIVYAGLVHFEPFLYEWRLRGGTAALIFFVGFSASAVALGAVIENAVLFHRITAADFAVLGAGVVIVGACYAIYRAHPRLVPRMVDEGDQPG